MYHATQRTSAMRCRQWVKNLFVFAARTCAKQLAVHATDSLGTGRFGLLAEDKSQWMIR